MADHVTAIIEQFKLYRVTHPNLSRCWLAYLELKKRHCDEKAIAHGNRVLEMIRHGCADWRDNDILRVLLYKRSV